MKTEQIDILLTRYFSGEATQEEIDQVDLWVEASTENEKYFIELSSLYQHLITNGAPPIPDVDRAFLRFSDHIHQRDQLQTKNSRFRFNKLYKVAILFLLIATGVLAILLNNQANQPTQITAIEQTETYSISDEVDVQLCSGSQIEYLKGKSNEVQLKGTATFSVNSKKENALTVMAGETFIKDIGTVFTVTAPDPQKSITVDVTEGEVLFYTLEDKGIVIREGESGRYDPSSKKFTFLILAEKQDEIPVSEDVYPEDLQALNTSSEDTKDEKTAIIPATETAEREATIEKSIAPHPASVQPYEILFDAEPLADVIQKLEKLYHTKIEISPELSHLPISVSFGNNDTIDHILTIISETLSVRLYKDGGTYILSK